MARRERKPTGLQQKTIRADSLLSKLLDVREGELVSPLDITKGLSRYARERGLAQGMEVEVDELLSRLTGFKEGERKPRTQLIQELWRYIDRHGLKVSNPKEQLRKVVKAAEEQVDRGVHWVDALLWALVVVGGAFVLSKLLQGGQGGQGGGGGQGPGTGEGGGLI